MRSRPPVACVLVTWNGWARTERCLATLLRQAYPELTVVVVDNGSADGTADRLRGAYPSVICIENGTNAGFAKACNVGARAGLERGAEFLWFLNNDTEAPPETLERLVVRAEADERLGIVGAVLLYLDDPERVQAWGGGGISLWTGYNRHATGPGPVEGGNAYVTFASALVRRRTWEELRGMWEALFLYFEDSDFSLRATRAGWRLGTAEDTAILHAEGGSAAGGERRSALLQQIQTRSGVMFLRRHGRIPVCAVGLFLLLRVGKRVVQGDWGGLRGVLRGAVEGCRVRREVIARDA